MSVTAWSAEPPIATSHTADQQLERRQRREKECDEVMTPLEFD
jgi:hypothetical protein